MGALLDDLREILGEDGVLEGERVLERIAGWALERPSQARAILRPRSTDEVARVVKRCAAEGQPLCVQGGMTGLVLGNVARPDEIALSLERMDTIEEVDPIGRTMTVQSGVPLQRIQEEAGEHGLLACSSRSIWGPAARVRSAATSLPPRAATATSASA